MKIVNISESARTCLEGPRDMWGYQDILRILLKESKWPKTGSMLGIFHRGDFRVT